MFVRGGDFSVFGDAGAGDFDGGMAHARLMRHPGPVASDRYTIGRDETATNARVHLLPGATLLAALRTATAELGTSQGGSAVFTLLHGQFSEIVYCLAEPDESGRTVATYTPWRDTGAVEVLGGSATFGQSVDGQAMVHCHAWFSHVETGDLGAGHLDPARTIIGMGGVVVMATGLGRVSVRQTPDPETNHAVFMPHGDPV